VSRTAADENVVSIADRPRRTAAPEVRRQQILEGAKACFRTSGFHGASMAHIAASAGVSVGLIYQHFPSKEALIEGIMLEDIEAQMLLVRQALDARPGDVRDLIRRGWRAFQPLLLNRDRTLLMIEVAAETARNPKLRDLMNQAEADLDGRIQASVARLTPPGWSRETMMARLQVLNGLLQSLVLRFAVSGEPPTPAVLKATLKTARRLFDA
jgi:AcrR family transcriptional regulator